MTQTDILFVSLLFIHWFADFVLQTNEQAKGKSKEWKPLLNHTCNYSIIWFFASFIYVAYTNNPYMLWFAPITFIVHTATDYYTSRTNSILWEEKKVHSFFVSIGFDQILHYLQLYFTFKLLS